MRSSIEPLVACVLSVALVGAGLYMRSGAAGNAQFLGVVFVVVGTLGAVANAALYIALRRPR